MNVVVAKTFVDMEARTSREQCAFVRQSRSIGAMPLSRRTQFRIMSWPLWSAISEIPLHGEFVDEISHKLDADHKQPMSSGSSHPRPMASIL